MKYKTPRKISEASLAKPVKPRIITLRGQRVILDADLAEIYGVEIRVLNQAVKRNADRFPEDFMFQLTANDWKSLRSQIVTLKTSRGQHRKYMPYAFTEHGAIMAATVLNSPKAVAMSVFVVRAFVQMRDRLTANAAILKRLAEIDKTLLEHNDALAVIWEQMQPLLAPPPEPPPKQIGYHVKEKRAAYNVRRARKWPKIVKKGLKTAQNGKKTAKNTPK